MSLRFVCLSVLLLALLAGADALRHKHALRLKSGTPAYYLERFSFLPGGTAKMRISHAIPREEISKVTLGLLALVSSDGKPRFNYTGNACPLDPNLLSSELHGGQNTKFKAFRIFWKGEDLFYEVPREMRGVWHWHLIVCGPVPSPRKVVINLDLDNIALNGESTYLSAEEIPLPHMFSWSGLAYVGLACTFALLLYRSPRRDVFALHMLMLCLIGLKILAIFCESFLYFSLSASGQPHGWNVAFYFFQAARGLFVFLLVLLIGSGWRLMRSLRPSDRYLFWIILPLQLVANLGLAAVEEKYLPELWFFIFQLLDILCCILVLSPILEPSDRQKRPQQLEILRNFYIILISYIYATRVISTVLHMFLPPNSRWITKLLTELATIAFFTFVGLEFRPAKDHPFFTATEEGKEV